MFLPQSVVQAHRPAISLPRTTVSPALLEELISEISTLASIYHKPAETFVGRGRIGADSVPRKGTEYVKLYFGEAQTDRLLHCRLEEDQNAARKAIQTVAAGQQSENLLNFDDPTSDEQQPSGLAATQVLSATPAAANLLSGTSSNPLDDLVSIFGSTGLSNGVSGQPEGGGLGAGLGGLSFGAPISPAPPVTPSVLQAATPVPTQPTHQQPQPPPQAASEDLLGLF